MDWDNLNQALLVRPYIDFNTARIAQPLQVGVEPVRHGPEALDFRGLGANRMDYEALTRQADEIRDRLADQFSVTSSQVYLGRSATETFEFFLRCGPFDQDDKALMTSKEYDSIEDLLNNDNYYDTMTWPAGKELLYQGLYERHDPFAPVPTVQENGVDELSSAVPDDTDFVVSSYVVHDTGEQLPVRDISNAANDAGALSVVDASQAAFQMPFSFEETGADLMFGSLHKYGHCLNTLGFGIWDGDTIQDTVHEPEYFLPRHREKEADDAESLAKYNGPAHWRQIQHGLGVMRYRDRLGWDEQYDRIEYLGQEAESLLGGSRESPGMVFVDGDKGLETHLREEYGVQTTYKESSGKLRVSLSPFNTEMELGVLARGIDAYQNDELLPPKRLRTV